MSGSTQNGSDPSRANDPWKRDRSIVRRGDGPAGRNGSPRSRRRGPLWVAEAGWEILGELVFLGLIALVSWLVYGELRFGFIGAVFFAVNLVFVIIAVAVGVSRRRPR